MSQAELAKEVGVTKRTYIYWEQGERQIKHDKAKVLADYFDVSIPYLLGYDNNDTFSDLIIRINEWAISHGLDKSNPKTQWMKVTEEVGEIRDVFLKPTDFKNPEWSLIVTLIVLCLELGYNVEECLTIAYNDIKDRTGVMIDDNFVKDNKKK